MSAPSERFWQIRATYRLQFHRGFTFRDATELVPYLSKLGISHVYASPVMEARPGSTHGYDIINHNRLNLELGGEEEFRELVDALHRHGMGLILDIVPNHMAVGGRDNAWWLDVLEWGRDSPFAEYFDINWDATRPDLKGRVLLPVLGDQYGVVLENGEIELRFDAGEGSFSAWYFEHRLPISPRTYPAILIAGGETLSEFACAFATLEPLSVEARRRVAALKRCLSERACEPDVARAISMALGHYSGQKGNPEGFRKLHCLLEDQAYRIADWRVAAEEINYRRFFNINHLAGLRVESPEVFERTHRLLGELIRRGDVQGLRVDHIDGLFDPRAYCERLQETFGPLYVLVEKILAHYETLPDWPVAGTTGYDFTNQVLGLFVDSAGERAVTRLYRRIADRRDHFDEVLYASKKRIMQVNLASEMGVLAREFHSLSMQDWHTRDFTLNGMRAALEEIIAAFPVYRPYVSSRGASAEDHRYIEWALTQARKRRHAVDTSIFDFLHKVLTGGGPTDCDPNLRSAEMLRVAMHFQQVTGPVMAKAYEDTAFYRYVRLVALNEVGGDPRRFGTSIAAFHHVTLARARSWPQAMVTTATHDTKHGEDARTRVALLSELPFVWGRQVARWSRLNRSRRSESDGEIVPARNIEYLFYQALFGAWPPTLSVDNPESMQDIAERLEAYMIKAVREGKERSSWSNPDTNYEAGLQRFVRGVLDSSRTNPFLVEFQSFVTSLARLGAVSSLSQLVLKLTVPGVPDIYQGGELWDFSLVDPDNRRPVDWQARRRLIDEVDGASVTDLSRSWQNGLEKLFIIRRLLDLRRSHPELFAQGDYRPIEPEEDSSNHVCAFARVRDEEVIVVVVPRLVYRLYQGGCSANWGAAKVGLPPGKWRDVFTGRCQDGDAPVSVSQMLADFPVAVLSSGMGT